MWLALITITPNLVKKNVWKKSAMVYNALTAK
jgi:hypothetical protein